MIIRSAILEGHVDPAAAPEFERFMRTEVRQQILRYPGIRSVTVRKSIERDDGAPQIFMQLDLAFDSLDAMRAALASPIRAEVIKTIAAGSDPFKGRVYHVVSDLGDD